MIAFFSEFSLPRRGYNAELCIKPRGRMYELGVHSLRKYFKTQLLALGVQPDYVDYMMGHTVDT
jgi:intergrase/recombinase